MHFDEIWYWKHLHYKLLDEFNSAHSGPMINPILHYSHTTLESSSSLTPLLTKKKKNVHNIKPISL
jgi:hypothetical protein